MGGEGGMGHGEFNPVPDRATFPISAEGIFPQTAVLLTRRRLASLTSDDQLSGMVETNALLCR